MNVSDFIGNKSKNQMQLLQTLHNYITGFPGIVAKMKYGLPFYYRKSWICYLNPLKNDGVELAFTRANEFSYINPLLNFKDRKLVAGITYNQISEIQEDIIREILSEAIMIDDEIPYSFKRK